MQKEQCPKWVQILWPYQKSDYFYIGLLGMMLIAVFGFVVKTLSGLVP